MKKLQLFSLLLLMAIAMPQTASAEYYGIKVAGVSVTSDNCDNITGSNIKRCSVGDDDYWVRYDPSTKTLTLRNIKIEREGSDNRAILNESCDGLTIVFDGNYKLSSEDASPIRLNANTTITSTKGLYGYYDQYWSSLYLSVCSRNSDAITISNGAQLVILDIQMDITSTYSAAFYGDTGNEKLILIDAFVQAHGPRGYGIKNISKLGVQNSSLFIKTETGVGVTNLKELTLVGKERMTVFQYDTSSQFFTYKGYPTTTPVYFSETEQTFLSSEDNTRAKGVAILSYVPIDEQNFPDEAFRNYVSEKKDGNSNGELDFYETLEADNVYIYGEGFSSLKGIEYLHFVEQLECRHNNLTQLDLSQNKCLTSLKCSNNQITRLILSEHPNLQTFDCSNNLLTYIDFSGCPNLNNIKIQGNRINEFMTETLESLPDVTEGTNSDGYKIYISNSGTNDNVCTSEQADIARNKGWDVTVGGLDDEGNVIYNVSIAGTMVTSANADDLTVLPGVTKNSEYGYAYYNLTTQTLCLNGVDIVNEDGEGIKFSLINVNPTIELGQEPVNITAKGYGIAFFKDQYSNVCTLTITTKESNWYSEKFNVLSTDNRALYVDGHLVLNGVARVETNSPNATMTCYIIGDLTIAGNAELRIKPSNRFYSTIVEAENLILEDDNIIVTPEAVHFDNGCLCDAKGRTVANKEVVLGKLREYNCYVGGTRVSNANLHAVLGDTTVVFQEPAYQNGRGTLVLNNANINTGSDQGIKSNNLNIKLIGENTVIGNNGGIAGSSQIYIQGPGSLYVKGQYGIDLHLAKLFISDDAKVTAEGTTRYAIDGKETTISGDGTIVRMKCEPDARGTFRASTSLTLNDGIIIDEPEGAQYVDGEIKDASGNVIKDEWVTLQHTERYEVYVAGIQVTNHNMADVLEDGTVSYDPETSTLTLNNANIDGGLGNCIEANQELHINLVGDNTLETDLSLGATGIGIAFNTNIGYIEGTGSLTINAPYGIDAKANALKILGGAKVTACALNLGIRSGITTIGGEETVVNTKGDEASFACMSLTLNDGLEIVEPTGAKFVMTKAAICVGRRNDIVTSWVRIKKVNRYDIYVAGTQVTNLNQADVLGDGTVSYDPETNTLTLNNANVNSETENGINVYSSDINIKLEGENHITSGNDGLYVQTVNIEGPGSLYVTGEHYSLRIGCNLLINGGAQVTAESLSDYAIITNNIMTVSGAETVLSMKGKLGAYSGFAPVFEDDLAIVLPEGAYYDEGMGRIVDAGGNNIVDQWVVIKVPTPVESYDLYIAGTQVTEFNKNDVLGDGTVSFDPETNTLTLNGADIEAEGEGLSTQIDEIIIKLEGENSIEAPEGYGIYGDASFTITGPGSLSVTSKFAALNGSFVIEGGAKVTADSQTRSALWSFDPLSVSGEETIVMLRGAQGAIEIYGAEGNILSLSDGLVLGLPEGAHCGIVDVLVEEEEDIWIPYGYILDANDNNITDQWVVIASQEYITGIDSPLPTSPKSEENVYNLAGQKVGADYKGIVIENGTKVLRK